MGLAAPGARIPAKKRVKAHEVAGIPGLWADIDVAHAVHKKRDQLPPDLEAAQGALSAFERQPTILVNSGHGLQAWWLFAEPWTLRDDNERTRANALTIWWHDQVSRLLQQQGWTVDATHDLSRLMRIPGTINNKEPAQPVRVAVLVQDGPRYSQEEIILQVPEGYQSMGAQAQERSRQEGQTRNRSRREEGKPEEGNREEAGPDGPGKGGLILRPDAEPPAANFAALIINDPKFKRSWEGNRRDLTDQSPSAYDMSLAAIAVNAGWSDQETANLMIARRAKHGHDLKLRESYHQRTIARAREPMEQAEAQDQLEEALNGKDGKGRRETLRENLTTLLGVDILRIVKYVGDPPIYWMSTKQGDITLGTVRNLRSQTLFCDAVATTTGVVIRSCKDAAWRKRFQALLDSCEEVEVGQASHPATEVEGWLEEYLSEKSVGDDAEHAATVKGPFRKDGAIYIFIDAFRKWVEFNAGMKIDSHAMGRRLKLCGAQPERVNLVLSGHRTTRNCWRLPMKS